MESTTEARTLLIAALNNEFTAEAITVEDDKLHESAGRDGRDRIAVYPMTEYEDAQVAAQLNVELNVQVYLAWTPEVDPEMAVSPTRIESFVGRIRRAVRDMPAVGGMVWFMRVVSVTYPADPTDNISRAELQVQAYTQNEALSETAP